MIVKFKYSEFTGTIARENGKNDKNVHTLYFYRAQ